MVGVGLALAAKTASTDSPSAVASRNATATEGTSRPVSMALISVRETPLRSASSACDQPRTWRHCATVLVCDTIMATVRHDQVRSVNHLAARHRRNSPMLHSSDLVRLLAVFCCSGIFWLMVLFLIEKTSLKHPLPGSIGFAILVLVLSACLLVEVVTRDT